MASDSDDYCNYNSNGVVLHVGGYYNNRNQNYGLFYLDGNSSASFSYSNIGSRIHVLISARSFTGECTRGYGCSTPLGENKPTRDGLVPSSERGKCHQATMERAKMKRASHLFEKIISNENISKAIDEVNKSHRWVGNHKPNKTILWVEATKVERIEELRQIVLNGFEPSGPKVKSQYDRNAKKWRDIAEPRLYPDQYVHHMLIQVLEPTMMRGMDKHCCGSVKGRGAHYGVRLIKKWMRNDRNGTKWCEELDIYHFYEQLSPKVVMNRMKCLIKDHRTLDLIERCLKFGVLIGAYFSQWFANTVLQPLDSIIRQCGIKHYIRYMDNFTLFSNTKRSLIKAKKAVQKWLEAHGMRLKGNWQYYRTRLRLPSALGYRFGHRYTLIRKHRLLSIKRQIKSYYRQRKQVSARFAMSLLSRFGGLRHCNATNVYKAYVPNGLQHQLKDVVRTYQARTLIEWEICLVQYMLTKPYLTA